MAACKSGSIKVVRAILQKGAAVNEIMVRPKHHAAHEAAKGGFLDCLQVSSAEKIQYLSLILFCSCN